jgi:5'-nucleotidase (lipoprotein e(P4) family)
LLCLVAGTLLAGCAAQAPHEVAASRAKTRCSPAPAFASGGERATLWIRTSAEYRAASEAIYRAAADQLARGLADPAWTAEPAQTGDFSALPPAVVMDIDETVLDNSEPQAQMLREKTCFDEFDTLWDEWIAERRAPAVPGATGFIHAARSMSDAAGRPVRVLYVTNRECSRRPRDDSPCPQEEDTLANLRALGLDAPTLRQDLMLKGEREDWGSEKLSRRLEIAKTYRIVLVVGDDFGDFAPGVRRGTVTGREEARCEHAKLWGRGWFMIPNPMYGSWLVALGEDLEAALAMPPATAAGCAEP